MLGQQYTGNSILIVLVFAMDHEMTLKEITASVSHDYRDLYQPNRTGERKTYGRLGI